MEHISRGSSLGSYQELASLLENDSPYNMLIKILASKFTGNIILKYLQNRRDFPWQFKKMVKSLPWTNSLILNSHCFIVFKWCMRIHTWVRKNSDKCSIILYTMKCDKNITALRLFLMCMIKLTKRHVLENKYNFNTYK